MRPLPDVVEAEVAGEEEVVGEEEIEMTRSQTR